MVPISSSACSRSPVSSGARLSVSPSSSTSSRVRAEKLLTKLSGFLISWAMPAVSWPSEASFSDWISRSCALRRSSSEAASSRVRACTSSNRRTFSIAITAWSANVCTISIWRSGKWPGSLRVSTSAPSIRSFLSSGTPSEGAHRVAEGIHRHGEFRVLETVGNRLHLAGHEHPAGHRPATRRRRMLRQIFGEGLVVAGAGAAR